MDSFFQAFYDQLAQTHSAILQAIDGLPQEALDWEPGPGMNSCAVLVVHTAGAERYLIGEVIGQDPAQRDRDAEFRTRGLDGAALRRRLDEVLAHSRGVLEGLTRDDLDRTCPSPRHRRPFTVASALLYTLDHAATHLGHTQMARQLWEQRQAAAG